MYAMNVLPGLVVSYFPVLVVCLSSTASHLSERDDESTSEVSKWNLSHGEPSSNPPSEIGSSSNEVPQTNKVSLQQKHEVDASRYSWNDGISSDAASQLTGDTDHQIQDTLLEDDGFQGGDDDTLESENALLRTQLENKNVENEILREDLRNLEKQVFVAPEEDDNPEDIETEDDIHEDDELEETYEIVRLSDSKSHSNSFDVGSKVIYWAEQNSEGTKEREDKQVGKIGQVVSTTKTPWKYVVTVEDGTKERICSDHYLTSWHDFVSDGVVTYNSMLHFLEAFDKKHTAKKFPQEILQAKEDELLSEGSDTTSENIQSKCLDDIRRAAVESTFKSDVLEEYGSNTAEFMTFEYDVGQNKVKVPCVIYLLRDGKFVLCRKILYDKRRNSRYANQHTIVTHTISSTNAEGQEMKYNYKFCALEISRINGTTFQGGEELLYTLLNNVFTIFKADKDAKITDLVDKLTQGVFDLRIVFYVQVSNLESIRSDEKTFDLFQQALAEAHAKGEPKKFQEFLKSFFVATTKNPSFLNWQFYKGTPQLFVFHLQTYPSMFNKASSYSCPRKLFQNQEDWKDKVSQFEEKYDQLKKNDQYCSNQVEYSPTDPRFFWKKRLNYPLESDMLICVQIGAFLVSFVFRAMKIFRRETNNQELGLEYFKEQGFIETDVLFKARDLMENYLKLVVGVEPLVERMLIKSVGMVYFLEGKYWKAKNCFHKAVDVCTWVENGPYMGPRVQSELNIMRMHLGQSVTGEELWQLFFQHENSYQEKFQKYKNGNNGVCDTDVIVAVTDATAMLARCECLEVWKGQGDNQKQVPGNIVELLPKWQERLLVVVSAREKSDGLQSTAGGCQNIDLHACLKFFPTAPATDVVSGQRGIAIMVTVICCDWILKQYLGLPWNSSQVEIQFRVWNLMFPGYTLGTIFGTFCSFFLLSQFMLKWIAGKHFFNRNSTIVEIISGILKFWFYLILLYLLMGHTFFTSA